MTAIGEIGWHRAFRFGFFTIAHAVYRCLLFPPLRVWMLRLMGARVGRHVVIHQMRFFNLYRKGFAGLRIADSCFIGEECLIDLAAEVVLKEHVTLAERVTVLTHMNVGYRNHPLQAYFPAKAAGVVVRRGAFVGACATLLPGVEVGECAVVAAGAVVRENVPSYAVVGGVPARVLRVLEPAASLERQSA